MFKRLFIILAALVFATSVYAAEVKISALPEVASVLATDVLPLNASGVTSKIQMVNLGVPGTVGASGTVPRGGGAGVIPGWSTFTIADTFAKGSFVYAGTANNLDALAHPGAANYLLATNAADTAAWFASSAAVVTILGSASAADFRTNAGLAIGTNVQAYSAILLGIAATTPAAGLLGYTGAAYDWYTGISLSNNSLRHFYDETAGYYSNSDCTSLGVPAACCGAIAGTGTCAPKYVGIDPVGMTGTKSATFKFQNTLDADYTFPVATSSILGNTNVMQYADGLLSSTEVSFAADADTTLYTVPAGKRCVLTKAIVVAAANANSTDISIGANGSETDWVGPIQLDNLDAQYDAVVVMPVPNATPVKGKSYAAATVIQVKVENQAGAAGNTIHLFGFCY